MSDLQRYELDPSYDVVDFLGADERADLTTCDREPIHLSGAIQPHGVLLALDRNDLTIRQTSANAQEHFGIEASELLGAPLGRALGTEPVARLRRVLSDPRASGADPLPCHLPSGAGYDLTWHRIDDLVVAELERSEVAVPGAGAVTVTQLFAQVRHAMEAFRGQTGVQGVCDAASEEIKHITGYDRVMVYRFHPDWHGEVIAERREPDQDPFLGLHYPASDIPRQARKLYLLNHLRVIADVGYEPVPLLVAPGSADGPLNLSLSSLRSVSTIHLAYLMNMGVQATLTISLMQGTALWGMIACHHARPKRISAQMRGACRLIGQVLSSQIVAEESRERDEHRARLDEIKVQLVASMSGAESLANGLLGASPSAVTLTAADGMVARLEGVTVTAGAVPPASAVRALLTRLKAQELPSELVVDDLGYRFDELAPFAEHASGVLSVPLSGAYDDFVLWLRGERVHDVRWAGNPEVSATGSPVAQGSDSPAASATGGPAASGAPQVASLSPRHSFDAWVQEVRGRSRPWLPAEIDAARALASAIPELLFERSSDRFAHLALHDPLTGLPNRALLLDRIAQALSRQQRGSGNVALLFIDLDHFKAVNDSLGHGAGDELLRQAARRIDGAVRSSDTAARIGGDEFVALFENVTPDEAGLIAERLVECFRTPFRIEDDDALVTASIGSAIATGDSTTAQLMSDADTAMYRAKHAGRNASVPFNTT